MVAERAWVPRQLLDTAGQAHGMALLPLSCAEVGSGGLSRRGCLPTWGVLRGAWVRCGGMVALWRTGCAACALEE